MVCFASQYASFSHTHVPQDRQIDENSEDKYKLETSLVSITIKKEYGRGSQKQ